MNNPYHIDPSYDSGRHAREFVEVREAWEDTGCLPETHATTTEIEMVLVKKLQEYLREQMLME